MPREKVELHISGIYANMQGDDSYTLVLKEVNGQQTLSITIGPYESQILLMGLKGFSSERPLTHDLLCGILNTLRIKLMRVVIYRVEKSTFYCFIYLGVNDTIIRMDARPSDALSVALKLNAPIFIYKDLLEQCYQKDVLDAGENNNPQRTVSLDYLQESLNAAIENEDYELAARLRDQINKLKEL